ncbi:hypothetical protein HWN40_05205 [Methanolobus zinderi]|jgi:hypothetical protein|uniref:DUF2683 family protein n=1 Tax=Methanolobus zinderi TaxID=536044 RepID=A0A7D5J8F6_9EURY|nr:DUF2683 family protein [Methanolobus zinderi]QLC49690.1 hypothetical protein HWN40_05205 [Methanolobus zinderi]
MRNAHTSIRKFSSRKIARSKKASYPPEECFNSEFIKEIEQSIQDVKDGKGTKYDSLEDLFASYEK